MRDGFADDEAEQPRLSLALASCRDLPDWEVDDAPFHAELRARGIVVATPAWDDAEVDWERFDAVLVRTTWDYMERRPEFVRWAERVQDKTLLSNPAEVIAWNTDKTYLRDVEASGAPIAPTVWLEKGAQLRAPQLAELLQGKGWDHGFLKPVVGATARETLPFEATRDGIRRAADHLAPLLENEAMMLQPFLHRVRTEGEVSLVFIDGALSHCVRKRPVEGDYRVQDDWGATDEAEQATEAMTAIAAAALRAVPGEHDPLLYARVDLLLDDDGEWVVTELEVTEPSLFFRHAPGAAATLADAWLNRIDAHRAAKSADPTRFSWNIATRNHNAHKGDQAAFLRSGGSTLFEEERRLLVDLGGKDVVHLQCNSGQDTLSLHQLGVTASLVGVDLSDEAIAVAARLARESGLSARFERADVLRWLHTTEARFDVAFASYGTLGWLADLDRYFEGVARVLRAGGRYVLVDFHPLVWSFGDGPTVSGDDYFEEHVFEAPVGDYVAKAGTGLHAMDDELLPGNNAVPARSYQWTVAQQVAAMCRAGLALEHFEEHPHSNGAKVVDGLVRAPGSRVWTWPEGMPRLPLMFSLVGRRGS